jgi:S1-C subfamily serine protease
VVGDAERASVRLADGRDVEATRWGGDPDLGVVVFKLPDEVARGLKGVDVEGDWARLGAGSVAVATDVGGRGGPRLGLVAALEPRLGTVDAPGDGAAVFGSRGSLIGLRGGADMTSCASCHGGTSPTGAAVDAALQRFVAQKLVLGKPHLPVGFVDVVGLRDPRTRPGAPAAGPDHLVAGPVIRRVLDDLEKHGAIRHSYLGVVVGDVAGAGAQITTVVPDSPAAAAGLVEGARILEVDGLACPSSAFFSRVLVLRRPGEEVKLSVLRRDFDAAPTPYTVRLGERSEARARIATAASIGLTCVELGGELRRFLGLEVDVRGVVVQDAAAGSPAAEAGMQRGDVITTGNGGPIADLEELNAALAGARGKVELSGVRSAGANSATQWTATISIPDR